MDELVSHLSGEPLRKAMDVLHERVQPAVELANALRTRDTPATHDELAAITLACRALAQLDAASTKENSPSWKVRAVAHRKSQPKVSDGWNVQSSISHHAPFENIKHGALISPPFSRLVAVSHKPSAAEPLVQAVNTLVERGPLHAFMGSLSKELAPALAVVETASGA